MAIFRRRIIAFAGAGIRRLFFAGAGIRRSVFVGGKIRRSVFVGGKIRLPEKIAVKAPVLGAPFDYAERPFDRLVAVRRAATL